MSKESIELIRHGLGIIDLSDINDDEEEMPEQERREYCATIHAVFPRLEKDIKKFLAKQLLFVSNKSENWEQVLVGRGAFGGMDLLLEHWRIANQEHIDRSLPTESFDKHNPIGDI